MLVTCVDCSIILMFLHPLIFKEWNQISISLCLKTIRYSIVLISLSSIISLPQDYFPQLPQHTINCPSSKRYYFFLTALVEGIKATREMSFHRSDSPSPWKKSFSSFAGILSLSSATDGIRDLCALAVPTYYWVSCIMDVVHVLKRCSAGH